MRHGLTLWRHPRQLLPASQGKAEGVFMLVAKALTVVLSKSNWVGGQDSFYTRPAPHPQNRTHTKAPFVVDHFKCLFLLLEMAEDASRLIYFLPPVLEICTGFAAQILF